MKEEFVDEFSRETETGNTRLLQAMPKSTWPRCRKGHKLFLEDIGIAAYIQVTVPCRACGETFLPLSHAEGVE